MSPYRTPPRETPREESVELAPDRAQRLAMIVIALVSAIRLAIALVDGEFLSKTTVCCTALVVCMAFFLVRRPRAWIVRVVRARRREG